MQPAQTPSAELVGDGSTDTLAFSFYLDATSLTEAGSQLRVRLITYDADTGAVDTVETLTEGVDYTVVITPKDSEAGDLAYPGGTITFAVAPEVDQTAYADRVTSVAQPTIFPTGGQLNLRTLEQRLDYLTRIDQEQDLQLSRIPFSTDPTAEPVLWYATSEDYGKYAAIDLSGNAVFVTEVDIGNLTLTNQGNGYIGYGGTTNEIRFSSAFSYDEDAELQTVVNLDATSITGGEVIVGDTGTEGSGINIGGVTYESSFKVSDIDGTNYAQTILHRHSTTLEPVIVFARSNSNTSAHSDVITGQGIGTIYAAGWAGSNYKLFGQAGFFVDVNGTVSNTSAPGCFKVLLTPNGSTTLTEVLSITEDGAATFAGDIEAANVDVTGDVTGPNVTRTIARSSGLVTVGNTDVETTLLSFTLAAGALSTNRAVRIRLFGIWSHDGDAANTCTFKLKYGSTTLVSGLSLIASASVSNEPCWIELELRANNSANAQIGHGIRMSDNGSTIHNQDYATATENSANALTVAVTAQWDTADASETVSLASEAILV